MQIRANFIMNTIILCFLLTSDTESIPFRQRMQHQFTGEPQKGERDDRSQA